MLSSMYLLAIAGVFLLVGARHLAGAVHRPGVDPIAATRMLQVLGALLLVAALVLRPSNPATTAVPPPPAEPVAVD